MTRRHDDKIAPSQPSRCTMRAVLPPRTAASRSILAVGLESCRGQSHGSRAGQWQCPQHRCEAHFLHFERLCAMRVLPCESHCACTVQFLWEGSMLDPRAKLLCLGGVRVNSPGSWRSLPRGRNDAPFTASLWLPKTPNQCRTYTDFTSKTEQSCPALGAASIHQGETRGG